MNKRTLKHADVIISYRGSTLERKENLYAILQHYELTYRDYRILLIEADERPKFDWSRLANPNIHHIYTEFRRVS